MTLTLEQALQKGIEAHKAGQAEVANRYYSAILKTHPEHPDANHNMGVLAVSVGKIEASLLFFKTAMEADPSIAQFWLSYINTLIRLNQIDKAKNIFDKAKKYGVKGSGFDELNTLLNKSSRYTKHTSHKDDQNQLRTLLRLYAKGDLCQVVVQSDKLAQKYPNSATLFNLQGAAFKGLGQLDLSIDAFKKALSIEPNFAEAYNNMGTVLKEQGKLEEAMEAYKKALSIVPDYADAHVNIGNTHKDDGKSEKAIEAYKKALSISPHYTKAYNNMGITLAEQGKLEEAVEAYKKALSITPDYAEAYNNIGVSLKEQGKLDEAMEAYKKALSIVPDYTDAIVNMGNALSEQRNLKEAKKTYNKALSIEPGYTAAMKNLVKMPIGSLIKEDLEGIKEYLNKNSPSFRTAAEREFFEAGYHMHNGETDLSFNKFCKANKTKLSELGNIVQNKNRYEEYYLQKIKKWKPKPTDQNDKSLKRIFILGPSCSGKSKLESILANSSKIKPLYEAHRMIPNDLSAGGLPGQLDFERIFFERESTLIKEGYRAITVTDPNLIYSISLIIDKLPNAYFIFIDRDKKNIAPEIFTKDYKYGHYYSYDPQSIIKYLDFYKATIDQIEKKRIGTTSKFTFQELNEDPFSVIDTISKLTLIDFSLTDFSFQESISTANNIFSSHFKKLIVKI